MKFGDIIKNGYVSEDNPRRIGIFVKDRIFDMELTDGKGKFWTLVSNDPENRYEVIGTVLKENSEI